MAWSLVPDGAYLCSSVAILALLLWDWLISIDREVCGYTLSALCSHPKSRQY